MHVNEWRRWSKKKIRQWVSVHAHTSHIFDVNNNKNKKITWSCKIGSWWTMDGWRIQLWNPLWLLYYNFMFVFISVLFLGYRWLGKREQWRSCLVLCMPLSSLDWELESIAWGIGQIFKFIRNLWTQELSGIRKKVWSK